MLSIVMDLQNKPFGLQFESNTLVKTTVKFDLTTNIVVETILRNLLLGLRIKRVAENNLMIIADIAGNLVTVSDIALDFDPKRVPLTLMQYECSFSLTLTQNKSLCH